MSRYSETNVTQWQRILPVLLILAGLGAIMAAIAVSLLGIGERAGFGAKQALLAAAGLATVVSGTVLTTSSGRRYLRAAFTADTPPASPLLSPSGAS